MLSIQLSSLTSYPVFIIAFRGRFSPCHRRFFFSPGWVLLHLVVLKHILWLCESDHSVTLTYPPYHPMAPCALRLSANSTGRFLTWQLLPLTLSPHCEFISLLCQTSVDILLFFTKPLLKFPHGAWCWPFLTPLSEQVLIQASSVPAVGLLSHTVGTLAVVLMEFIAWKFPLHRWPGLKENTSNSCPKPTHHEPRTIYNLCS